MEKLSPRSESPRKLKTNILCIPSLKNTNKNSSENYNSNNHKAANKVLSPITLLERFREAVFRVIMMSAMSSGHGGGRGSDHDISSATKRYSSNNYYHFDSNDHRNSESVADCIEFIKKKAEEVGPDEINHRDSSATTSSDVDSSANSVTTSPVQVVSSDM